VNMPQIDAIEKMRNGEIDSTVCICPRPVHVFTELKEDTGFRLLDIPFVTAFHDEYLPSAISREDYPALVAKGGKVETIATTTVLVSFNWPRGSVRYNRTVKFVDALFSRHQEFLKPPRQPSWKTVNFAGKVTGWQRFAPAQEWLDRREQEASKARETFDRFIDYKRGQGRTFSPSERERLFRDFREWSQKGER